MQIYPAASLVRVHPDLVLQMSKIHGWDDYFGTAGTNLVCQDSCTSYCKPLPVFLSQILMV